MAISMSSDPLAPRDEGGRAERVNYHEAVSPLFFIVDAGAGAARVARLWRAVVAEVRRLGLSFEFELTQGALTGASFTRQALRAGARTIVAVGDDGTLNEVVNGFFLDGEPLCPEASLALIPAGSSSVIARGLGIPGGLSALGLLVGGQPVAVDVGVATFAGGPGQPAVRYFLNNADVGMGDRAAAGMRLKWAGGIAAFFLASVAAVTGPRPWHGSMALDEGDPEVLDAVSVVAALGPFTGGGMHIAPQARMDDGLLDVVTVGAMDRGGLLRNLPRIYRGHHLAHPRVRHARARTVRIESDDRPLIELDGEVVGAGGAEFRILPGAIRILVPAP